MIIAWSIFAFESMSSVENLPGILSINNYNAWLVNQKKNSHSLVMDFFFSKTGLIKTKMDLRFLGFEERLFLLDSISESFMLLL